MLVLFEIKEEGHFGDLFFACVLARHKKVGVLADLVLVSTCEGDARVGEATSERLEMTREQY